VPLIASPFLGPMPKMTTLGALPLSNREPAAEWSRRKNTKGEQHVD
jgi:hypothetical protein